MVTTETGLTSFDQRFYQAMATMVGGYIAEAVPSAILPSVTVAPYLADEYKKPIYGMSQNVYGETRLGANGRRMETPRETRTYKLAIVRVNTKYGPEELREDGQFVIQKRQQELRKWADAADLAIWSGVYTEGYTEGGAGIGTKLNEGILDQAGAVIDLDGTDSALTSQGDVFAALTKMVESIPFRYRQGREIVLAMTPHFYNMANSSTFTYSDGSTEWEKFFDKFITKGIDGYRVSRNVIVSNAIFGNLGDTVGTHDRLMAIIPDPNFVERAYSMGVRQLGQMKNEIGEVIEAWGVKLAGCVHDNNAVLLSEQITWA